MWFTDTSRGCDKAQDPHVIHFDGRFLMYYLLDRAEHDPDSIREIGIAESPDLENWQKIGEITAETPTERHGIVVGSALVEGGRVHLLYYTYGTGRDDAICYAISNDGVVFDRAPDNPVFRATGEWNSGRAINPWIVPFDHAYRMYFCSRDPAMEKQFIMVAETEGIAGLESANWRQLGAHPVFTPELEWEHDSVESPAIIEHEQRYYMFYGGGFHNQPQQVGCARSDDGLLWKRLQDKPLLAAKPLPHGRIREYAEPSVCRAPNGASYLFVQVTEDYGASWFITHFKIRWQNGVPCLTAG